MRRRSFVVFAVVALVLALPASLFADTNNVLKRWSRSDTFTDSVEGSMGGNVTITVTYYASEYVEALVHAEAEKNLWTEDEAENYKYELLKVLKLEEYIPIKFAFDNRGPSLHMAPFGKQLTLWIGKKKYKPMDYDRRFNFKLKGKREGLVYFPRYDEKTGKSLLEGVKTIKLTVNSGGLGGYMAEKSDIHYLWDVDRDNPEKLLKGRASARLEMDRLIKRLARLNDQKKDLEKQLAEVQAELDNIQKRVDEIQAQ